MRIVSWCVALVSLAACQSRVAAISDRDVHLDVALLRPGVSRDQIVASFGQPNKVERSVGIPAELYRFNFNGTKVVDPKLCPHDPVYGSATGDITARLRQMREAEECRIVNIYRVQYGIDGRVISINRAWDYLPP
jgi:hypothetical protein